MAEDLRNLTQVRPDPGRQQEARQYAKLERRGWFLELGLGLTLLIIFLVTPASTWLASRLAFPTPWSAALYLLIIAAAYRVVTAPLSYYYGFALPHRYGLSKQSLAGWLTDKVKSSALQLSLGLCLVVVLYWLMWRLPTLWWLAAAAVVALASVVLTWLTPILVVPMFFRLKPLPESTLKDRLANLARRAGVNIADCLTIDLSKKATTANAMVTGWGRSRRIIFSDTLLEQYSWDEIEVTLAHELAHRIHRDIPRVMGVQIVAFLLTFYLAHLALRAGAALFSFQGISDVAALPWLILVLVAVNLVLQPVLNWLSRRVEMAADRTALALTNNPRAFVTLMTKLTDQNLAEAEPSRWAKLLFYDHPTYNERVRLAHNFSFCSQQSKTSQEGL